MPEQRACSRPMGLPQCERPMSMLQPIQGQVPAVRIKIWLKCLLPAAELSFKRQPCCLIVASYWQVQGIITPLGICCHGMRESQCKPAPHKELWVDQFSGLSIPEGQRFRMDVSRQDRLQSPGAQGVHATLGVDCICHASRSRISVWVQLQMRKSLSISPNRFMPVSLEKLQAALLRCP